MQRDPGDLDPPMLLTGGILRLVTCAKCTQSAAWDWAMVSPLVPCSLADGGKGTEEAADVMVDPGLADISLSSDGEDDGDRELQYMVA